MNDFSSALNNFQAVQRRVSEKEKESIARARAGSRLSVSSFPREGRCKLRVSPRHFPLPTTGPVHSAPNESHLLCPWVCTEADLHASISYSRQIFIVLCHLIMLLEWRDVTLWSYSYGSPCFVCLWHGFG